MEEVAADHPKHATSQTYPLAGLQLIEESLIQRVVTQAVPPIRIVLLVENWP
jgi:hypothetical protein